MSSFRYSVAELHRLDRKSVKNVTNSYVDQLATGLPNGFGWFKVHPVAALNDLPKSKSLKGIFMFDIANDFAAFNTPYTPERRNTSKKPDPRVQFRKIINEALKQLADPQFVGGKPSDPFKRNPGGSFSRVLTKYGTHHIEIAGHKMRQFDSAEQVRAFYETVLKHIDQGSFDAELAKASTRKLAAQD